MKNQYLKSYQVTMRTVGPVFVGSGREIGKKEYVFLNKGQQAGILDIQCLLLGKKQQGMNRNGSASDGGQLYHNILNQRQRRAFEDYLLDASNTKLAIWLRNQNIKIAEIQPFIKYRLDCGDAVDESNMNKLQVMECIKDAYGNPYIPGSTLKGMFRTILLGADMLNRPERYQRAKAELKKNADPDNASRNNYLKREMAGIENIFYRTLNREDTKPDSAVNDTLQGLVISDSDPLSVNDLVLCQKVELHTNGMETKLPLLRECIKPNTEIRFSITVDTSVCGITEESLMGAVKTFMQSYYNNFAKAFRSAEIQIPKINYVLCGGGCGFVSKTVIYPMYGKNEGMDLSQKIFEKTKVPRVHKHDKDKTYGASPHILKCTRYQGKLYQMGMCRIEKIKLI